MSDSTPLLLSTSQPLLTPARSRLFLRWHEFRTRGGGEIKTPAHGVLVLIIVAAACSDITEPAPAIVMVSLAAPSPLVRALTVELDRPGAVTVTYGDGSGSELEIERSEPSKEHRILVARLLPSSEYSFRVLSDADQYSGSFSTDSLPANLAAIDFDATGTPSYPLTLVELHPFPPATKPDAFRGVVIIDGEGRVVWYFRGAVFGVTRRPNGNFVFVDLELGLLEVTPAGSVVALLPQEPDGRAVHHDVTTLSDGTVLFLAQDRQLVNDTSVAGEAVWNWNPDTGAETKLWSSFDHLSPIDDRGPRGFNPDDWLHANSLSVGPRGNVLVSLHALNQVISISPGYQSLEWRLGGVNATIQLPDGDRFSGQHTAVEVEQGRVLMFDNGLERETPYSRALEVELTDASARNVWEFRPPTDNWSRAISSARRLSNGNTLIGFGMSQGIGDSSGPIEVYEVTPTGEIVWRTVISGDVELMYRATALADIVGERSR